MCLPEKFGPSWKNCLLGQSLKFHSTSFRYLVVKLKFSSPLTYILLKRGFYILGSFCLHDQPNSPNALNVGDSEAHIVPEKWHSFDRSSSKIFYTWNCPCFPIFQNSDIAVITPSSGKNVAKWSPILVFLARSEGAEGQEEELKEDGTQL